MMYKFIILLICSLSMWASDVEITSKQFDGDENSGVSIFTGNVVVKKQNDTIYSDKAFVYTDKKRKPQKFEFIGNPVRFHVVQDANNTYKGYANKIEYYPLVKEYIFIGNAFIENIIDGKRLAGEHITVNQITRKAKVNGGESKPAKFIFKMEDEKK